MGETQKKTMDGSNGSNDLLGLLENSNHPFWTPPSSSSSLQETLMMNFGGQEPRLGVPSNPKRNRIDRSLLLQAATPNMDDFLGEEDLDGNANQADKKRRLTKAQVKSLEKSFAEENKLEPDRKIELAKKLGLQPKQVSIWFQNRRARYKSKQIEKEYDTLKANYDQLQEDYAIVSKQKKNSDKQVDFWKNKYFEEKEKNKEKNETNPNQDALLQLDEEFMNAGTQGKVAGIESGNVVVAPTTKQAAEDVSSAKSDIYDSESPHCMGGNQSSALPVEASSTLMRDLDQHSDFSQDDNEQMIINNNLLLPQTPPTFNNFLKVPEDVNYDPDANSCNLLYDPNANSCNFSLVDEQPVMWPWLY